MQKAIAKTGETITGNFCMHYFIYAAADLTPEELLEAIPLPNPITPGQVPGGEEPDPTQYIVVRQAIQTMGQQTIEVKNANGVYVEISGELPLYTEIVPDSARNCTGLKDKYGNDIFEGDNIRYQCGIGDFETYIVIFDKGKYTTSPHWPWGCNYGCFDKMRIEVIG